MLRKKIIPFFVILSILLMQITVTFAADEALGYCKINVGFGADFEKGRLPFAGEISSDSMSYGEIDAEHGTSLILDSKTKAANVKFVTKENEKCTAAAFSYDMYLSENKTVSYGMLISRDESGEELLKSGIVNNADETTIYRRMDNNWSVTPGISREAGIWNHYDIWVDYDARKVEYYVNYEKLGEYPLTDDFASFEGFSITMETVNGGGLCAIDNIYLRRFTERGKIVDTEPKIAVPEGFEDFANISMKSEIIGGNYFGKSVDFGVNAENLMSEPLEATVEMKILSEDGRKIFEDSGELSADVECTGSVDSHFDAPKFGFYDLHMKVTNKKDGRFYEKTVQFAVMEKVEEVNRKVGIASHTERGSENAYKQADLMARAGMSAFRNEIRFYNIEVPIGSGKFDVRAVENNYNVEEMRAITEHNADKICVVTGHSRADSPWNVDLFPKTEYELSKFENYCYNLALQMKEYGCEIFEIWNEWNIHHSGYDYTVMCKRAATAIKKANPDAKVYGLGGVTNIANMISWTEECFENGIADYCDGFTIHPYAFSNPPEYPDALNKINAVKDIMKRYGCEDKELVISEFGWSSYQTGGDDVLQAAYTLRWLALNLNAVDRTCFYTAQEKTNDNEGEKKFGWIRSWTEEQAAPYEPYAAKPVLVMISNYNKLLNNAEEIGAIDLGDSEIYARRYKTAEGEDCIIIWTNSIEKKDISLNLGADNLSVIDMYGNRTELELKNKTLDLTLSAEPVYILGKIEKCEAAEKAFEISNESLSVTIDDTVALSVIKNTAEDCVIGFDLPDNITVSENNGFSGNSAIAKLKVGESERENEIVRVYVKDKTSGKICFFKELKVEYKDTIDYSVDAKYYRNNRWQVEVSVTNNKSSDSVSGNISITEPAEFSKIKIKGSFKNLTPGSTTKVAMNVPDTLEDVKVKIKGNIKLDSDEVFEIDKDVYFAGMAKVNGKAPKIDGKLDKGEWNERFRMSLKYQSQANKLIEEWKGTGDLNGEIYYMYDNDNFYLGAKVYDDIFYDFDADGNIYKCDSIQFAFTEKQEAAAKRTEYSIAMLSGKPSVTRHAFIGIDMGINLVSDTFDANSIELQISRDEDNKMTYYEARVPWTQIFGKEISVDSYKKMYVSALINDNDGGGRKGYLEFCPGIGASKSPDQFIDFPLIKN